MVTGLDKFREHFRNFSGNYIVIGGTACDIIIGEAGLLPRVTKDIDCVIIAEALSTEFVSEFWKFIKDGQYRIKEKEAKHKNFYRFKDPVKPGFPKQVELFSRKPDLIDLHGSPYLTPVPAEDDLSSLSAILLNDEYYGYTLNHSSVYEGVHHAKIEALICLKAKAFLELTERKKAGRKVDQKQIDKHRNDIFRLGLLLSPVHSFELPELLKTDMTEFLESIKGNLPPGSIFKEMGAGDVNVKDLLTALMTAFKVF